MANNVLLVKEFNPALVSYSAIKTLESGARSLFVNYENNKVLVQLPWCQIPYGINDTEFDGSPAKSFKLTLSMRGWEGADPKMKALYDMFRALENKFIADGITNSLTWFKKKTISEETLRTMFNAIVKHDTDKESGEITNKYPPTYKVKLPHDMKTGAFTFTSLDMAERQVDFAEIKPNVKGGRARLIIQLSGLWFAGGGFGATWRVYQGQFDPSYQVTGAVKFRKEDDEDDAVLGGAEEDDDLADAAREAAAYKAKALPAPPAKKTATATAAAPVAPVAAAPPAEEDDEEAVEAEAADEETDEAEAEADEEVEDDEPPPPPPPPPPPAAVKKTLKKNVAKA